MARSRRVQSRSRGAPSSAHDRIAAEIRVARQEAGLTQRELAARLNKSPAWVAGAEKGRRRLFMHELPRIAAALGIDVLELLERSLRRARGHRS